MAVAKTANQYIYDWESVVIGGTLDALVQAHKTDSYIIFNNVDSIFPFDAVSGYEYLGLNPEETGTKIKLWNALSYDLARKGLNPFGRAVVSTRVDGNHISVVTGNNHKTQIRTSKIHVHSVDNVHGLEEASPPIKNYRVFDWFDVRTGMNHEHVFYERQANFCNKFYFYLSERIDGNKKYKDLVVESELSILDLKNPDYSDTTSRIIATRVMKELGIHGAPRLETKERQIIPIREKIYYEFSFSGNNSC